MFFACAGRCFFKQLNCGSPPVRGEHNLPAVRRPYLIRIGIRIKREAVLDGSLNVYQPDIEVALNGPSHGNLTTVWRQFGIA
jgi:hypothetical protein